MQICREFRCCYLIKNFNLAPKVNIAGSTTTLEIESASDVPLHPQEYIFIGVIVQTDIRLSSQTLKLLYSQHWRCHRISMGK